MTAMPDARGGRRAAAGRMYWSCSPARYTERTAIGGNAGDERMTTMAEWVVFENDTPQCSGCGMWMPFARYWRGQGTYARKITNYCPCCGRKMTAMPMCGNCKYGQGAWKEDGICYACREQVWIPGAPHRKAGEEYDDVKES